MSHKINDFENLQPKTAINQTEALEPLTEQELGWVVGAGCLFKKVKEMMDEDNPLSLPPIGGMEE